MKKITGSVAIMVFFVLVLAIADTTSARESPNILSGVQIIIYDADTEAITTADISGILPLAETGQDGEIGTDPPGPPDPDPEVGGPATKIIPLDDRKRVRNTTSYPWRTICQIRTIFPDGTITAGSGALIGKKYVLTAGHVVYNAAYGGFAKRIRVTPGLNGVNQPYPTLRGVRYMTFGRYINNADQGYDMAVLSLDQAIGNRIGWLGLVYYANVVNHKGNLPGYPIDKDPPPLDGSRGPRQQWRAFGSVLALNINSNLIMNHNIDATPGESGASIYAYNASTGSRRVFAVHKGSGDGAFNLGVYLDAAKYKVVSDLVNIGF